MLKLSTARADAVWQLLQGPLVEGRPDPQRISRDHNDDDSRKNE